MSDINIEFGMPIQYHVRRGKILKPSGDFSATLTMEANEAKRMHQFFYRLLTTNPKTWAMLRRLTNRTRVRRNGR